MNISCPTSWVELRKVVITLMIFQWCKQYDPLHQLRCNFIISFQLIAQSLTCQYDPMYNIYLSTLFVPKNPWFNIMVLWIWPSWCHGQKLVSSCPLSSFPGFCTWLRLLHLGSKVMLHLFHMHVPPLFSVVQILYWIDWVLGDFSCSITLGYTQFSSMTLRPGPQTILAFASNLILFWGSRCLFLSSDLDHFPMYLYWQ